MFNKISKKWMDDEEMKIITQNTHMSRTKYIRLYYSKFTSMGMLHFSNGKWNNLIVISIYSQSELNTKIGGVGCKYFSRVPLPNIQSIKIHNCGIDSNGVLHLYKTYWQTLKALELTVNRIGLRAIQMFVRANWKSINLIDLCSNPIIQEQLYNIILGQNTQMIIKFSPYPSLSKAIKIYQFFETNADEVIIIK